MSPSREVAAILGIAVVAVTVSIVWFRFGGNPVWLMILAGVIFVAANARRVPLPSRNAFVLYAVAALVIAAVAAASGLSAVAYAFVLVALILTLWIV